MELQDLLKPISDHIQEIQGFRERNRGSGFFNHLSAVSESIPAIGWVAVVRTSAAFSGMGSITSWCWTARVQVP